MKIIHNFDNKLYNRTEYLIEVNHPMEKTPENVTFRKKIAELTKNKEDLIKIKGIHTRYGQGISDIYAYVYDDEKSLKNFEVINKKNGKKDKGKEKSKK